MRQGPRRRVLTRGGERRAPEIFSQTDSHVMPGGNPIAGRSRTSTSQLALAVESREAANTTSQSRHESFRKTPLRVSAADICGPVNSGTVKNAEIVKAGRAPALTTS